MKIISFPFAGGSKYSYENFFRDKSGIVVVEYPGRGLRINEEFITDIDVLVEDLLLKVKDELKTCDEYIIYGHSMGALIGYLICCKLQELELKMPQKLVVSGRNAPSIRREKILSHLEDGQFWKEVIKMGGVPNEFKNHPELMQFYVPILKADFVAIENFNPAKKEILKIPIDVFYGSEEDIKDNEIMHWKNESVEKVTITALEGKHFFIFHNKDFFASYFKNLNKNLIY